MDIDLVNTNGEIDDTRFSGIRWLDIKRFRNYDELRLDLSPSFNVLIGRNAQGKTNLLEAIHLLSTTRILRGSRDTEAIQEGSNDSIVSAGLSGTTTEISILLQRGIKKRALLNGVNLPRAADLIGRLPSVCISSQDLPIVQSDPSDRRLFLDLELSQLYPAYLRHLATYKRALEQRNALLKRAQESSVSLVQFEPWNEQLAQSGSALRSFRSEFVSELSPTATSIHASLGDGEHLTISYLMKDESQSVESLLDMLNSSHQLDVARGTTTIGPHRDDLVIIVGDRDARHYGSQGQQRTTVLSLKLATLQHESETVGVTPLLLLDDILSDLDETRRSRLTSWVVEHARQTVLTCTELELVGSAISNKAQVFNVSQGRITS